MEHRPSDNEMAVVMDSGLAPLARPGMTETALFSSTFLAYITPAVPQGPAMAINGRRNKPIGPGGSTRRLHPCSVCVSNPIPVGSVLPVRADPGAALAGPK